MAQLAIQIIILVASVAYRWSVALHSYSGHKTPPMFGDYEAQRHWMEITLNLPLSDWYVNSTSNNLSYWGLDYPPLTAYHSYLLGHIANRVNPAFVELVASRGIETYEHKLFMRYSVLAFDLLIFYPSVIYLLSCFFAKSQTSNAKRSQLDKDYLISLLLVLLNPNLVLIDHGHFQYNSISLGLFQLALLHCFKFKLGLDRHLVLASVYFCLALNYKQMELYHALPIFYFLLGLCLRANTFKQGYTRLALIGAAVLITFFALWFPFYASGGVDLILQLLIRIFPFQRGLFEDKVANFWCSLSVLIKLREKFSIPTLSRISLAITFLSTLPSCINLLVKPTRQRLLIASVNTALVFYLFSFQVHEKSILLATVPACMLINYYPLFVSWFILVANFSMFPLLYKDGLVMPYISTSLIFISIVVYYYQDRFWPSLRVFSFLEGLMNKLIRLVFMVSMMSMVVITGCHLIIKPPSRYPDLWTVLNCVFSCLHFIAFAILFHMAQFTLKDDETSHTSFESCFTTIDRPIGKEKKAQ